MKKELVDIKEIETNNTTKFMTDYWIELCKNVQKMYKMKFPLVQTNGYFIDFQDLVCVILIIEDKGNPVKFSYNSINEHFHLYQEILK